MVQKSRFKVGFLNKRYVISLVLLRVVARFSALADDTTLINQNTHENFFHHSGINHPTYSVYCTSSIKKGCDLVFILFRSK